MSAVKFFRNNFILHLLILLSLSESDVLFVKHDLIGVLSFQVLSSEKCRGNNTLPSAGLISTYNFIATFPQDMRIYLFKNAY